MEALARFRSGVRAGGLGGRGCRYPRGLRIEAVRHSAMAEMAGRSRWSVSRELGVAVPTLDRWINELGALEEETGLREVVVIGGDEGGDRLRVISPSGYRIEGLRLAEVVELLGALG